MQHTFSHRLFRMFFRGTFYVAKKSKYVPLMSIVFITMVPPIVRYIIRIS